MRKNFFRRHRNPKQAPEKQQQGFFQPKLAIGRPDDQYEREADTVADSVVNQQQAAGGQQTAVQRKPIGRVQRLATPDEENMPGTNDARMAEDKEIQEKPEVQRMGEEEEPVQTMGEEEEEPVQAMGEEEEEPVQAMGEEEEEPVQAMGEEEEEPVQAMGEEEEEPVQAKASVPTHTPAYFSTRLAARSGMGKPLPKAVRTQMEQGIGADFSNVRIHTDTEAAQMSKDIKAQAFTRGEDVYFNSGKYDPVSTQGKRLLAHELTHVVQQGAAAPLVQRKAPSVSTPIPEGYQPERDAEGKIKHYRGRTAGVEVIILPDAVGDVPAGKSGVTSISHDPWSINAKADHNGRVAEISELPVIKMYIQTTYRAGVDPSLNAAYGRGTTGADKAAGNTSLRHHEGTHGTAFMAYMRKHPLPVFQGKVGMKADQFQQAIGAFEQSLTTYMDNLEKYSTKHVDCVGTPASDICPVE
ncbi:MAG: DUF4157 domain-containing protein [Bacteroidota bacterium]